MKMIQSILDKFRFYWRAQKYAQKWDPAEIHYIRQNVYPGDIAIDIGAHKGGYLYWLRKQVDQSGKLYCFEPQVKLFDYLKKIQNLYQWTNVFIENKGVGANRAHMALRIPGTKGATSPGATLAVSNALEEGAYVESVVEVVGLDEFCDERGIQDVSLIKIDVEGFELEVLRGAEIVLKKWHPDLLIEIEQRHLGNRSIGEVFQSIVQQGYTGFFFYKQGPVPLDQFQVEKHQKNEGPLYWNHQDYCNNFLFIGTSKMADKKLGIR